MDENDPNFDPNDDSNYQIMPIQGDDPRRYFIFFPAEKAKKVVSSMNERDEEEENSEEKMKAFFAEVMFSTMPKEEACQDVLPLNDCKYVIVEWSDK